LFKKGVSNGVGEVKIWSKFANSSMGKSTDMGKEGVKNLQANISNVFYGWFQRLAGFE
jgi:hypothetical protein